MLGVMAAHFGWIFSSLHTDFAAGIAMSKYFEPSAPTFMLISGLLLGYIYEKRNRDLGAFALKLMDRGLFLLTVGHIVIMLAYVFYSGGLAAAATYGQITDAIGLAIILGPILISYTTARTRIALGLGLFVLSWILIVLWDAQGTVAQWFKDTMFGAELERGSRWGYNFPIVPWVGLYIVATAFGQHVANLRAKGSDRRLILRLFMYAAIGFSVWLSLKVGWALLQKVVDIDTSVGSLGYVLYSHTDAHQKWPPSLAYYVFNCSISMMLLGTLFYFEISGLFRKLLLMLAVIGQNSLFVFLVQEHVYVSLLWIVDPPLNQLWFGIFLITILINVTAVYVWQRFASTKFFTVGFGRVWGPRTFDSRRPRGQTR